MIEVGRLDLGHGLRQFFEVAGGIEPALAEGIIPAVILADLRDSPFGLSLPWVGRATGNPVAGQHAYVVVQRGTSLLPRNSWISVDRIIVSAAAGVEIAIEPYAFASLPALAGGTAPAISTRQIAGSAIRRSMPEISIVGGNSATVPNADGIRIVNNASSIIVPCRFAVNEDGALVVAAVAVNTGFQVSFMGDLHLTSVK